MAAETVDAVTPKRADSLDVALQRWRRSRRATRTPQLMPQVFLSA
jgi:hypothetical protein